MQQENVILDSRQGIHRGDFDDGAIRQRRMVGGPGDGVDLLEVDNGELQFTILPTRGMSIWRGQYRGIRLGWDAPVAGPVHPKFVNQQDRGGLGWLTGFDEFLVRCGLNWNGPPGDDNGRMLTLHGRIANCPAHRVTTRIDDAAISVTGTVEEGGLFYPQLQLITTYITRKHSSKLMVIDSVVNLSGQPVEMQMLYHCNLGPPLLGVGSRTRVPFHEVWPMTAKALAAIDDRERYGRPTVGFEEEVFCAIPIAGADGRSLATLTNAERTAGLAIRWETESLPYFTLWKNTAAIDDGYVTGLEPATNFPRFRGKERAAGRVRTLAPREAWTATMMIEVSDQATQLDQWDAEIDALQLTPGTVHDTPLAT